MTKRTQSGFTLIELMIVVAIVAILARIAYPAYTDSVLKGKRAQGRTALMELMQQQERYMTQRNCYLTFSNTGGSASGAFCGTTSVSSVPFKLYSGDNQSNSAYLLYADACPSGSGTATLPTTLCVRVVATPQFTDPRASELRMTSTGLKDCTGTTTDPKLCWP